ncbi:MAG: PD-(D/E)XK nuclease family protein [Paludibacteraceae bacterium]|nr:PD-(D/E)XK nuclease family protein [Paludibacteraceae bacterium]
MNQTQKNNIHTLTSEENPMDTTFLQLVAHDLHSRYGNDLSGITVVFPNRRARLFFNEHLCQQSMQPVWAPSYVGLDELFHQASTLHTADPLKLLTELYYCYTEAYKSKQKEQAIETFDEFYFFGEILLNDFQDVDKNLVNEMALFSNLAELDQLKDDFEHLDAEQWQVIQRFFNDIATNRTQLKEAFFSIWNILGTVYKTFKEKLISEGIAYDGMLYRLVVEELQANGASAFSQQKYAFVGFNVLTECEKTLFKLLKQNDKALFYWDFDDYYMTDTQEAGRFMRDNISRFGNDLPAIDRNILARKPKKIQLIASPSESAQAGYIPQWIEALKGSESFEKPDSAIVLCNEQNLQAVMHAIPPSAKQVNITMGFPLTQTPVYSLLTALADLQLKGITDKNERFRYNYVLTVLRHPYIRMAFANSYALQKQLITQNNFFPTAEELNNPLVFCSTTDALSLASYLTTVLRTVAKAYGETENNEAFSELYNEALFRAFQVLNRLTDLLSTGELKVEQTTFVRLLKRLLATTSVPFHGEPARGLQVMGVLETRNMDFKNVLMMSTNEGVMPKTNNESSFIPHFIRRFFGMTTIEHQDSLYAYYFYRLMQRAENIVFMYNTANQQTGKSEMSRFLLQLLTEFPQPIAQIKLQSEIKPHQTSALQITKTTEVIDKIKQRYDFNTNPQAHILSPSAFNNYLDCRLRFYLQYIEGIKPPKELDDALDSSVLGSVFHKTVELIYREIGKVHEESDNFSPFVVRVEQLEGYLAIKGRIDKFVEKAFNQVYFKRTMPIDRYNGEQLIYFRIVKQFVKRLLKTDCAYAPFTIIGLEKPQQRSIKLNEIEVHIGGTIDRLDSKNGVLRVIDYKTGGTPKEVKEMKQLFESSDKRANYIFQAFVYASIMIEKQSEKIQPALVYINKNNDEDYSPVIKCDKETITDFNTLNAEFETAFTEKLNELFDKESAFCQTQNAKVCEWCDFKNMCGR